MTKSKIVGGMGFRDLALFSDSLLAKQAWRLLKNTNSLFYKVFEACFFFQTAQFWKQRTQGRAPMLGKSFLRARM